MSTNSLKSNPCLGFLTVVENADLGLLGGYLLLNPAGRPLEFHCTAPLKPNRAQEILYGPTLRPFLYGEQIGQALLTRSKLTPVVVCTDSNAVLAAREVVDVPLVLVRETNPGGSTKDSESGEALVRSDHSPSCGLTSEFRLARNMVALAVAHASDEARIRQHWPAQADTLDLLEPFVRIREALEEAQRSARAA